MTTLQLDANGWLTPHADVERHASPHRDARPEGGVIDLVVLHNISLPPYQFRTSCVRDLFLGTLDCSTPKVMQSLKGVRVSSHFYIDRDGRIHQFVSTLDRAWHAGVSSFLGRERCNDFSIGIELEGSDFVPFEEKQYAALERLMAAIHARHATRYVVGHSDIAPGRKTDPGPYFDWYRLYTSREQFGSPDFVGAAARMQLAVRQPDACIA